jgi:uncharacterized protein YbjT (DUF2867 family)
MDNLLMPMFLSNLSRGVVRKALPPDRPLQVLALADLANLAALVFDRHESFLGKRIDIASDELTGAKTAEILTRVIGRPIRYEQQPLGEMSAINPALAAMYEWFDRVGYRVDFAGLHRQYPEVGWHTFEEWANEQDWAALLIQAAAR